MYAFVLPEVEGGKREAEAVLVVAQAHLPAAVEHGLDRAVGSGAHQAVVDPQVAELKRHLTEGVDIGGVEHGDAIGAAEDQTAIRQEAGGTIDKLVATNTVGLVERRDAPRLTVPAVQSLHRGHPDIALCVFLDAAHVRAGDASNARHLIGLQVVAQQTVAHGAYPHVALGVLQHIGGDIDAAADALCHRGDIEFGELPRLGVHLKNLLEEGGDEHLSVAESQQRGNEAEVGIEGLSYEGRATAGESHDVVAAGGCPDRAIVGLFEIHHASCGRLMEDGQAGAVVAALQCHAARGEPEIAVAIAEDMCDGILLLT